MSAKPLVTRGSAQDDVEGAITHYAREASLQVALNFVDTLEDTFASIARHPGAGSPRYGPELNLPGLRHRALKRFPYLVFYVERPDQIDVWRVLHAQRDIPERLRDQGGDS